MPLIDSGSKICHPLRVRSIKLNDIITVRPIQVVVGNKYIVFPPLSLISDDCENEIRYPTWVEGYKVKGDEEIRIIDGNDDIEGEFILYDQSILTGYSLIKLISIEGKINLKINTKYYPEEKNTVILSVSNFPLVLIEGKGDRVTVLTRDYEILFKLFAYSLFYYLRSSSSTES